MRSFLVWVVGILVAVALFVTSCQPTESGLGDVEDAISALESKVEDLESRVGETETNLEDAKVKS